MLKDCCRIEDGAVLAPDTVVPPFAVFGGVPARQVGELSECASALHRDLAVDIYRRFVPA